MTWQEPDTSYWDNKFAAYWHDPIDKVFNIRSHEDWSSDFLQVFGLDRPNEEFWRKADAIAAGFERGQVPSHSPDKYKNGAVDFAVSPIITHPTSGKNGLLSISCGGITPDEIHAAAKEFLKKHIGMKAGEGDYAERFEGDNARFAMARLLYTHLVLRFILAEKNIGGLGGLWHRIPADSRFPDHSIWQHNALCSAIYSCMELSGKPEGVGLMVFSITPVQGFISRARKTRDFWVGSVFLSWLAFEGIRWVMENLGADHVLYPSLIDQPLVSGYLEKKWNVSGIFKPELWKRQPSDIASLPNKFLFLIPFGKAEEIAAELKKAIAARWKETAQSIFEDAVHAISMGDGEKYRLTDIYNRQTSRLWEFRWAAARLADNSDKKELEALLDKTQWENQFEYLKVIRSISEKKGYSVMDTSRGVLYSTSHSLVQAALAAEKSRRSIIREEEPGEKCQMCGEFEVLHAADKTWEKAKEYSEHLKSFWREIDQAQKSDIDFKNNERLCAICLVKRMAVGALKKDKDHILNAVFRLAESFPSTTEMALHDYFQRQNITAEVGKRKFAQRLHEDDSFTGEKRKRIENRDRYYAILMMDGDNMGKLINGETIAATWKKIMHPDIAERLEESDFDPSYRDMWSRIYESAGLNKRLVTPAIHAAISEALGDFSIYGVAPIIEGRGGRLIYAGGDDVCAFLPIGNALSAAREIQDYYKSAFHFINKDGQSKAITKGWSPAPGKLSINLGIGDGISISAAILICHHKESLQQMIERTQQLLKKESKDKAGRDACSIELLKRGSGPRYFTRKWNDPAWDAFEKIRKTTGGKTRQVSRSLLYRLETMRAGIEAIIERKTNVKNNLTGFIMQQLERSGTKSDNEREEIAPWITDICLNRNGGKESFNPEGLLIAAFLGGEGESDGLV